MKTTLSLTLVLKLLLIFSCGKEEGSSPESKSSASELLTLMIEYNGAGYSTVISGSQVTLADKIPFGVESVIVKSVTVSPKATVNIKAGDLLTVSNNSVSIHVQAENGTTITNYNLTFNVASPLAEILSLTIRADKTYTTLIQDETILMQEEMPYLNDYVLIESLSLSNGATANRAAGDTLFLPQKTFSIEVFSQNAGEIKSYSLELLRDEGLEIQPNFNLEATSSYKLQVSDVYINGVQLTNDWDRFFNQGYGDFNNDGFTDVLLAGGIWKSFEFTPFRLFYGDKTSINSLNCECGGECNNYNCDGFLEVSNFLPPNSEGMQNPRKILTGDYNNDEKLDAFIIGHGYDADPFPGESPVLLINNGNGFNYNKLNDLSGFYHGGSSADFDNDGDLDIFIIGSPSEKNAIFLVNDGNGNFIYSTDIIDDSRYWKLGSYYTAEFIDINLDGFMDLIMGGHFGNEHNILFGDNAPPIIFWGNSYGKYFKVLSTELPTIENYKIAVDFDSEDIDGDGDRDIIINRVSDGDGIYGFYNRHYIQILENKGDNIFVDKSSDQIVSNHGSGWREWIHLQDLDQDGDFDIYYEGNDGPHLKWLNNGQGHFTKIN
ncbi:MAG: FG-GAP-like repeat-containing protein [Flavobacteriaceae bacterium]